MWEYSRLRNTFSCYEYEDRIAMDKMLVLVPKSTMLYKISIFKKPFKKKTLSHMLVWYISKHTAPLKQCKRTPDLPRLYLPSFWQILHFSCVIETFVWSISSKGMFAGKSALGLPRSWRRNVNPNGLFQVNWLVQT